MTKFNFPSLPGFGSGDTAEKPKVSFGAEMPAVIDYVDAILNRSDVVIDSAVRSDPGYDMPPAQAEMIARASTGTYIVPEQDLRQVSATLIEQAQQDTDNPDLNQQQILNYIDSLHEEMRGPQ